MRQRLFPILMAAAAQVVVGHPFDTIKTRLQNRGRRKERGGALFRSLYRGSGVAACQAVSMNVLSFTAYSIGVDEWLLPRFLAGAFAGGCVSPSAFVFGGSKILRQVGHQEASVWNVLGRRGYFATVARESLGLGAYFSAYDLCHNELELNSFAAEALAGLRTGRCRTRSTSSGRGKSRAAPCSRWTQPRLGSCGAGTRFVQPGQSS